MKFNKRVLFMQEGGPMPEEQGAPMPAEAGAPAPQGGEDPVAGLAGQLVEMLLQQVGDNLYILICALSLFNTACFVEWQVKEVGICAVIEAY